MTDPLGAVVDAVTRAGLAVSAVGGMTVTFYVWVTWLRRWRWPGRELWGADTSLQIMGSAGILNPAKDAFTGGVATRWSTNAPQQKGMWFRLDLARTCELVRITVDQGRSHDDKPAVCLAYLSEDGRNPRIIPSQDGIDVHPSSPIRTRFVMFEIDTPRLRPDGTAWWWSIHDIRVQEKRIRGLWTAEIK